jgi:CheY-like chemotaxis protein
MPLSLIDEGKISTMAECKSSDKEVTPNGTSKYLLVVGTAAGSLVYTTLLLQKLSYHVCSANNAEEALEMVNAILPALVIADLKLPGMSGPQMIQVLRKNARTASVPVIIKLEQVTPLLVQKCREAGALACIGSPVQPEELYRVVQAAIEPTPREHIRIPTRLSVVLNNVPLDYDAGECATMLSSRGLFIQTQRSFPVKTLLPVQITVDNRPVIAVAKVLYCYKAGEGPRGVPGMGLYFAEISKADEDFLQKHINEKIMTGIALGGHEQGI